MKVFLSSGLRFRNFDDVTSLNELNRPLSYSTKEPGSNDIFIQFYTRGLIEWRWSLDRKCTHSKILRNVMKYCSIHILFQNN